MTTLIPNQITTPDEVDTPIGKLDFCDGVPPTETVDTIFDYVDRARAVEVFINMIPAVSMFNMRKGQRALGLTECNQVLIWQQLADSKSFVLNFNTSTPYAWSFFDLKKDGPIVIDVPPGMLGALNDMYSRYIADIGVAGQDKGKGGKHLVLPPDDDGDVPDGYFVVKSKTYGVWNFMRGYLKDGLDAAVKNIKDHLKAYPLSAVGANRSIPSATPGIQVSRCFVSRSIVNRRASVRITRRGCFPANIELGHMLRRSLGATMMWWSTRRCTRC